MSTLPAAVAPDSPFELRSMSLHAYFDGDEVRVSVSLAGFTRGRYGQRSVDRWRYVDAHGRGDRREMVATALKSAYWRTQSSAPVQVPQGQLNLF